jgi:hypothetical protein
MKSNKQLAWAIDRHYDDSVLVYPSPSHLWGLPDHKTHHVPVAYSLDNHSGHFFLPVAGIYHRILSHIIWILSQLRFWNLAGSHG